MLGKRSLTIKIEKPVNEDTSAECLDDRLVEEKVEAVLQALERVAIKAFAGFCVYMILDTHRKVAVAKASNPSR